VNFAGQRLWAFAPERASAMSRGVWIALGGIVAVAAVLRFWHLGSQGFWYDEAVTAALLRGRLADVMPTVTRSESTPPLYYLLAWGWVRVFGHSEAGLRSLSAVAGLATVPAAFGAARALAGARIGLIAAALVAVNPFLIWYSQEARAYALLALTSTLALWMFARARQDPTPRRLFAWGLAASLALCTHYFSAFALVPEALLLLADRRASLGWRALPLLLAGSTAVALMGMASTQHREHHLWFTLLPLRVRIGQIASQSLVGFDPPATSLAMAAGTAAVAAALGLLALRAGRSERRAAAVVATVAAGAILVPVALAMAGEDFLNTRNVTAGVVPLAVLVAIGAGTRRAGLLGVTAVAVLAVVSVAMVWAMATQPAGQRAHWRTVAAALRRAPGAPPKVILVDGSGTWARPLNIYLPDTWWLRRRTARVSEVDVLRKLPEATSCARQTWWGAACDMNSRRPRTRLPWPAFRLVSRQRVAGFEIARWRAPHPVAVRGRPKGRLLLTPTKAPVLP
jgi:uncharacterized membrane protein